MCTTRVSIFSFFPLLLAFAHEGFPIECQTVRRKRGFPSEFRMRQKMFVPRSRIHDSKCYLLLFLAISYVQLFCSPACFWTGKQILLDRERSSSSSFLGVSWHFFVGVSWKFESLFLSFFLEHVLHTGSSVSKKALTCIFFFAVETHNKGKKRKGLQRKTEKKVFISQVFTLATLECAQSTRW